MPKKPAGKKVDLKLVEDLARIGCTQDEIGEIVGITARHLRNIARAELDRGFANMKTSLRRWQYKKAEDGNVAMLIWLGKQYLGQSERQETKLTEEVVTIERIAPKIGLADTA